MGCATLWAGIDGNCLEHFWEQEEVRRCRT